MNAKEVQALESYFKTDNVHWNRYALEMLCEVLKHDNFENREAPLELFNMAIDIFCEQHETPLKAFQDFSTEIDRVKLTPAQRMFVYEWVYKYLRNTEFEGIDLVEIMKLLKSHTERMKQEKPKVEYNKPLTENIRDLLKVMMQKEIESLPDTLKELEPVKRLNVLCKIIPYVLPKVESVSHTQGEPRSREERKEFTL